MFCVFIVMQFLHAVTSVPSFHFFFLIVFLIVVKPEEKASFTRPKRRW
jgi:hypothetical protein